MKRFIGITQTASPAKNQLYANWIKSENSDIEIVPLSYSLKNFEDWKKCDAIVLSGGIDIHPGEYGNERLSYPPEWEKTKFDKDRDAFEKKVFEAATNEKLPILAICRGMQLVNCILGGDLIQDLQESGKENHSQIEKEDIKHKAVVENGTLLSEITKVESGEINSAHHQALGEISDKLRISAKSEDNVVEAVEYKDKTNKPFLLCVQWHPERLKENEQTTPFTKNIREAFLASIKK